MCVFAALRTRGLQITNGVLLKTWFVILLIFGTWSELFHRNNDRNKTKTKAGNETEAISCCPFCLTHSIFQNLSSLTDIKRELVAEAAVIAEAPLYLDQGYRWCVLECSSSRRHLPLLLHLFQRFLAAPNFLY